MMMNEDDKYTFNEDVDERELHSKLNVDDHIYMSKKSFYGFPVLVALFILLLFSVITSLLFGFINLSKNNGNDVSNVDHYDLIVIHTNSSFGGNIDTFSKYNALNKAYSYDFAVKNTNSINIDYEVDLVNNDYNFKKLDMSLIRYRLMKNDVVVREGSLKNQKTNNLLKDVSSSNSEDKFKIVLWNYDGSKAGLDFKINIGV